MIIGQLGPGIVTSLPGRLEPDLRVAAQREPLFLAPKTIFESPVLAAGWGDF